MELPDPAETPGWDAPERAYDEHPDDQAVVYRRAYYSTLPRFSMGSALYRSAEICDLL